MEKKKEKKNICDIKRWVRQSRGDRGVIRVRGGREGRGGGGHSGGVFERKKKQVIERGVRKFVY